MGDGLEWALRRVEEAMDRVIAGFDADDPDLVVERHQRLPAVSALHPDPDQQPVTTRQSAEIMRLRASALRQEGFQVRAEAAQLHHATLALRAWLGRPHPGALLRVSPAILMPPRARHRW